MPARASILILAIGLALSSCGGRGGDKVTADLGHALHGSIKSADLKLDAQLSIQGLKGFERPARIQASGPYVASRGALPMVDLDITAGSPDAGQTVQGGILSTGDRAFLKFGSGYYEQPQADVARANRKIRANAGRGGAAGLGLNPRDWIVDARSQGDAEVAGTKVERFSGKVDLKALFSGLDTAVRRSANVVGGAAPSVRNRLTPKAIDQFAAVVRSPTFDIYVGKKDGLLRRLSGNISLSVPAADRARFGGISNGSLSLTLELSNVNGRQKVVAPRGSRPISDLSKALGGIGALGSGALGGNYPRAAGTDPGAAAVKAYSDCLDKAKPDDTGALRRCKKLLK